MMVLLSVGLAATALGAIPADERQALIDLYTSTNGAAWTDRTNWRNATDTDFNDPGTECTWFGVVCDGGGTTVVSLQIRFNNLAGPIPASLAAMDNLTGLVLHSNHLTGSLPPELGSLSLLHDVRLDDNDFSGQIPAGLGNLTALTNLELEFNQLTGPIPPELGNLTNLRTLGLNSNLLSGPIPAQLGGLSHLQNLWLDRNKLGGTIPPELGSLATVTVIDLKNNQLSGPIPAELASPAQLDILELSDNDLTGSIPSALGTNQTLRELCLGGNRLSGPVPPELGSAVNLQKLRLEGNMLKGPLPTTLLNLTNLQAGKLGLAYNAVFTDDVALKAFLDARESDWASTQTVPPTALAAGSPGFNSVTVSWTPIAYTANTGGYRVWTRRGAEGSYQRMGMTADKTASSLVVTGLEPGSTYSIKVQTTTYPHPDNSNTVESDFSPPVEATTPGEVAPVSAEVDAHGGSGLVSDINGVLEPGETVEAAPSWQNVTGIVRLVSATASSFGGPAGATYTLGDSVAGYGPIPAHATANCHDATGNCYVLGVSDPETRPATHWDAHWLETLASGETKTWLLHIGDSFDDVPRNHWAYRFVETILHHEVTAGCGIATYCPEDTLTRAQMAVLLLAAKHGKGWTPPPATGAVFTDVPADHWAGAFIEELAAEGITAGCGTGLYCPDSPITRAEMAVFLLAAEHGSGWTPPLSTGTVFTDVPVDHWAGDFIEQLAAEGITGGCAPSLYCPDGIVTRAEMAVFLTATFGLELY